MSHTLMESSPAPADDNHVEYPFRPSSGITFSCIGREDPTDRIKRLASCIYRDDREYCDLFCCTCPFLGDVDRCNEAASPSHITPRILRQPHFNPAPRDMEALVAWRALKAKWAVVEVFRTHPDAVAYAVAEYHELLLTLSDDAFRQMTQEVVEHAARRGIKTSVPAWDRIEDKKAEPDP